MVRIGCIEPADWTSLRAPGRRCGTTFGGLGWSSLFWVTGLGTASACASANPAR
jgi:hypothetical protein